MINIEELRIGNWVSFKGMWYGQVKEVSDSGIIQIKDNGGIFDDENIQAIHITKDLLYKLGATDFPSGDDLILNNRLISYAECRNEYFDKVTSVTLKSVHQYQNFYFALTNIELQISLFTKK